MEADAIRRALTRISHEIIERNKGTHNLALIGIRTRGVPLAQRIAQKIAEIEQVELPVGVLDISLYRDDLTSLADQPIVNKTEITFPLPGKRLCWWMM